jgi:hypothetical protein
LASLYVVYVTTSSLIFFKYGLLIPILLSLIPLGGTFYFWGVLDSLEIERGFHTPAVMDGFKKGMALFVFSEVIFFFSFF